MSAPVPDPAPHPHPGLLPVTITNGANGHPADTLITVGGVPITSALSARLTVTATDVPRLELVLVHGDLAATLDAAHVTIDPQTETLLRTLGWTDPDETRRLRALTDSHCGALPPLADPTAGNPCVRPAGHYPSEGFHRDGTGPTALCWTDPITDTPPTP